MVPHRGVLFSKGYQAGRSSFFILVHFGDGESPHYDSAVYGQRHASGFSKEILDVVVNLVHIFHIASGMSINMKGRKLLGFGVQLNDVQQMAMSIVCEHVKLPFEYLGLVVGENMTRPKSWKCVVDKVGNGSNTDFRNEIWFGDFTYKYRFYTLYVLENQKNVLVAEKMAQVGWTTSFCRLPTGSVELAQWEELTAILGYVVLSSAADRWRWTKLGSGDFTVSSARSIIDEYLLPRSNTPTRWSSLAPIKNRHIISSLVAL
ncbi:hypothetical protein Tco_1445665 [Tanacetum coccineum]